MSFREKSLWACLLSLIVIYAVYFVIAFQMNRAGAGSGLRVAVLFSGAVVAQVVSLIVAHAVFAAKSQPEPTDERDLAIELRSLRYSHVVLSVGVMLSILGLVARGVFPETGGTALPLTPFALGHALLLAFVIAEATNYGAQVFFYRRGV